MLASVLRMLIPDKKWLGIQFRPSRDSKHPFHRKGSLRICSGSFPAPSVPFRLLRGPLEPYPGLFGHLRDSFGNFRDSFGILRDLSTPFGPLQDLFDSMDSAALAGMIVSLGSACSLALLSTTHTVLLDSSDSVALSRAVALIHLFHTSL